MVRREESENGEDQGCCEHSPCSLVDATGVYLEVTYLWASYAIS